MEGEMSENEEGSSSHSLSDDAMLFPMKIKADDADSSYEEEEDGDGDGDGDGDESIASTQRQVSFPLVSRKTKAKGVRQKSLESVSKHKHKRNRDSVLKKDTKSRSSAVTVTTKRKRSNDIPLRQRPKSQRAVKKTRREKWTEVLAAAHILQDQLVSFFKENRGEDREYLVHWTSRVIAAIKKQNQYMLENIEVTTEKRLAKLLVSKKREELVVLKMQLRHVQEQVKQLQNHIDDQQEENASRRSASRFLHSLDRLRRG
jgi:hypothetical protein